MIRALLWIALLATIAASVIADMGRRMSNPDPAFAASIALICMVLAFLLGRAIAEER